jgi:hypothetical protein
MAMSGQLHVPVALPQASNYRYPLNKKLRGLYSRFGILERRKPSSSENQWTQRRFRKSYTTLHDKSFRGLNSLKKLRLILELLKSLNFSS